MPFVMSLSMKIIFPYLLPWLPRDLIPRKDVINNSDVTVRISYVG